VTRKPLIYTQIKEALLHQQEKQPKFKRQAAQILLNGEKYLAFPDSGSGVDIMSESFAKKLNLTVDRCEMGTFTLGNGKQIQSIGRTYVSCSLLGDGSLQEYRWFHVLKKCVAPVVLGMAFLQKSKLFTSKKHLLVNAPSSWFGSRMTLKYLGSMQSIEQLIPFSADGHHMVATADTGSDSDFMSPECARRQGFYIDERESACRKIQLADGSLVDTVGQVHISSIKIGQFDNFERDFHILPGLPCDVIFGEELFYQMDAFSTCSYLKVSDATDGYKFQILINLGPIQAFMSKNFNKRKSPNPSGLQDNINQFEERERFRRNQDNLVSRRAMGQDNQGTINATQENATSISP